MCKNGCLFLGKEPSLKLLEILPLKCLRENMICLAVFQFRKVVDNL